MDLHLTLQGKGGVGKTLVTTLVTQYLISKGETPLCIDTDPVNTTFAGFKTLSVKTLKIMDGDSVNIRNFDTLVEMVLESKNSIVIDNGAASFIPLTAYLNGCNPPPAPSSQTEQKGPSMGTIENSRKTLLIQREAQDERSNK